MTIIKIESRKFFIKVYLKTQKGTAQAWMFITTEYIPTTKVIDLDTKTTSQVGESVIITASSHWEIQNYVKNIVNQIANGLGKAVCKSDTIVHKCIIENLKMDKNQLLQLMDTIIDAIENEQQNIQ